MLFCCHFQPEVGIYFRCGGIGPLGSDWGSGQQIPRFTPERQRKSRRRMSPYKTPTLTCYMMTNWLTHPAHPISF